MAKQWKVPFVNGKPVAWTQPARSMAHPYHSDEWNERCKTGVRYVLPGKGEQQIIPETELEWKDNYVFHDTLTIIELERGRSAAHYIVQGKDGTEYVLFVVDLLEVLQQVGCRPGAKIEADWTFCKRGQNYGVKWVNLNSGK